MREYLRADSRQKVAGRIWESPKAVPVAPARPPRWRRRRRLVSRTRRRRFLSRFRRFRRRRRRRRRSFHHRHSFHQPSPRTRVCASEKTCSPRTRTSSGLSWKRSQRRSVWPLREVGPYFQHQHQHRQAAPFPAHPRFASSRSPLW